ncbi:helix-turn-helix domain-containing protein [Streptosporangium sp. NBC_01755]|uniref:helix-turn-helix domain-containing protein n=1 Tax=Streptosporangium sp. NBC_01755 TaxID=2975949 RepID=UPI002DDA6251|nr:helix-turn-helix transcriptional regulator [Streptosporangium sp. NBC_01755]WSC98176.1 helix-turn-helix domain-containing protein [Streptosporangium sp. NBC_01755]
MRRRRLAAELRRLRERAQLTMEEVGEQIGWSATKISRIETSRVGVVPKDVGSLLDLYRVDGSRREELLKLARDARKRGWWQAYSDLSSDYTSYISLEAETTSMRSFGTVLLPGLVQTEDYARAVIRAGLILAPPGEVERRIEVRMARQSLLTQTNPLRLWTILDEAAVCRTIGGSTVMRAQLKRLLELAELPNVTIQVLPFTAGAHSGTSGAFEILEFPEPADPDVVFLENLTDSLYVEREADVYRYTVAFDHLRAKALDPDDSRDFIAKAAVRPS